MKDAKSSGDTVSPALDRLSAMLERFRVRAHLFHQGPLCGVSRFEAAPGRGFLHVMRRGEMKLTHLPRSGAPRQLAVREPSLLFYPLPFEHHFHHQLADGSDFTCATVDFEGGESHPLVRALPPVTVVPLAQVGGMAQSLQLLFAETEQLRCGSRLLADRLFEVVLIQLLRWLIDHGDNASMPLGLMTGLGHPQIARALVRMHQSPGEPWTLEQLAAAAGMSRSSFAATFKQVVGQTPADHLADWRLGLAKMALRNGRSLKSIAGELGYGSASALSRAFAQKLGQSPRAWLAGQV